MNTFLLLTMFIGPPGYRAYTSLSKEICKEMHLPTLSSDESQILMRRMLDLSCGMTLGFTSLVGGLDAPTISPVDSLLGARLVCDTPDMYLSNPKQERTYFLEFVGGVVPDSLVVKLGDHSLVTLHREK